MRKGRALFVAAVSIAALAPGLSQAGSKRSWDGTWVGTFNSEPVSVTISGNKVVSYAIRGGQPYDIGYSKVTLTSVSFGDHANYDVKLVKVGDATASGFAHSPLGDGAATLKRQ